MAKVNKLTFENWMKTLNILCERRVGLSIYDLPDQQFDSLFEDEFTPQDALEYILEDEGYDEYMSE